MWCGTKSGKILIFNAQDYTNGEKVSSVYVVTTSIIVTTSMIIQDIV